MNTEAPESRMGVQLTMTQPQTSDVIVGIGGAAGDDHGIGLSHFVHPMRRNINLTHIGGLLDHVRGGLCRSLMVDTEIRRMR
jgi:hypothetical protein